MRMHTFLQDGVDRSTITQLCDLIEQIEAKSVLLSFAYGTASGYAEFRRRVSPRFWTDIDSRWLFGIDYGRTDPQILRSLSKSDRSEVRIFNGREVCLSPSFVPEQDFHPKMCVAFDRFQETAGLLIGSGNFSRSGLTRNIECGITLIVDTRTELDAGIAETLTSVETLWNDAVPVEEFIGDYSRRWKRNVLQKFRPEPIRGAADLVGYDRFWVDAGYVTKNRGSDRPGDQIDLPRGSHRFFALNFPEPQLRNSPIGAVPIIDQGEVYLCNMRLGKNYMEKITLPFPELIGAGAYEGKVIEFRRQENNFDMTTYESIDFFSHIAPFSRRVHRMRNGRLFGFF